MNDLKTSSDLSDKFDFKCCWTCKNCVFELDVRLHECLITKGVIKGVHAPTDCKSWVRG